MYDVIVVGAGVEGSSTAYQLAKKGTNVLLLEQFPLPHSRGSSHGQTRITRKAYGSKDFYTMMMHESYDLLGQLEAETGQQLFSNYGCLMMGPRTCDSISGSATALKKHNIPHEVFGTEEQRRRYPKITTPGDFGFVLDKTGGVLRADKILRAFQERFVALGGKLRDGEPVTEIVPGHVVTVKTNKGEHKCRNVVLALGPWAATFLPRLGLNLPLKPIRITVCYWKERTPGEYGEFPAFLEENACGPYVVYGLPSDDYPGLMKICLHSGPDIDPDHRDMVNADWVLETMKSYIARRFPALQADPSVVETCIYTNTPDEDLILDSHPRWKNIIIAAGFSGHGFKLAPVVGKILAELALGQTPSYDLAPFRIDRFAKSKL